MSLYLKGIVFISSLKCLVFLGSPVFLSLSSMLRFSISPIHLSPTNSIDVLLLRTLDYDRFEIFIWFRGLAKRLVLPSCSTISFVLRVALERFKIHSDYHSYFGLVTTELPSNPARFLHSLLNPSHFSPFNSEHANNCTTEIYERKVHQAKDFLNSQLYLFELKSVSLMEMSPLGSAPDSIRVVYGNLETVKFLLEQLEKKKEEKKTKFWVFGRE